MYQMSLSKEGSSMSADSAIHLMAAVKGLHWRNSLEIHKLLRENEDFCICYCSGEDSPQKIDVEKMAGMLPRHLIAVLISPARDEKFEYLLCGIRFLHTLCDLTSRHAKLEQVLLDDVKISEQMLDLVIFSMIVLGGNRKVSCKSDGESLIHATLVASSLYLLHGFISPHYQELVQVLLAHPKVNIFIDAAFGAVHNVVRSLQKKLMSRRSEQPTKPGLCSAGSVNFHCQQAEAALQFIHSLCQHKLFRDLIAKNKELCGNGGVLMLAQSILSLTVSPEFVGSTITLASVSRMKAKVLSILQHLFEAESVSFLDEVASAGNLHLAKTIASEVLELLRLGLSKASKSCDSHEYPMGFVLLNAMRLADVLTDDSNFRSFFTENFSKVLSAVFSLSHGDFLSMLCSSDLPSREDDAIIDYDLYTSVGWVLSVFSDFGKPVAPQVKLNSQNNLTMSSYAHQRTSLLIKMIANLHCFVPNLCKEQDRNRFIQNFMNGLQKDPSSIMANLLPALSYTPMAQRGTGVCKNLRSLVRHAESLIPNSLNEEDFLLLRVFFDQLQPLIRSEFQENQVQATQDTGGYAFAKQRKELLNLNNGVSSINEEALENSDVRVEATSKPGVNLNEEMERIVRLKESDDADANNLETSGSDTSSTRGKSSAEQVEDGELLKTSSKRFKGNVSAEVKDDEKTETLQGIEKQRRKRKRSIMNDTQIGMIERALVDEPDMQRNSSSIQSWADKLSQYGSEVTSSQLKNWLNNRKAKLARASKQAGPVRDSSGDLGESPGEENTWQKPSTSAKGSNQGGTTSAKPSGENLMRSVSSEKRLKVGQDVVLMDERGEEVGSGKVMRVEGEWNGLSLETRQVCVVDAIFLCTRDWTKLLPFVSDDVGITFQEACSRFGGIVRVTWDVNKLR